MIRSLFFIKALTIMLFFQCLAQENVPLGTWRTHFSYNSITALAISNNKIYAGSSNGLFYHEMEFNSTVTLSSLDGFSNISISKLANEGGAMIVAYSNGDIDLIKENKVFNVPVLKNAKISASKNINDIEILGSKAFISTNFGIALLDLAKNEIKEVYQYIGANGTQLEIFSTAVHKNHLYASSNHGLYYALLDPKVNLQDFNNWNAMPTDVGLPTSYVKDLVSFNSTLYAATEDSGVYQLVNDTWTAAPFPTSGSVRSLRLDKHSLLISQDSTIVIFSGSSTNVIQHPLIKNPVVVQYDEAGKLWIADGLNGLLRYSSGKVEAVMPGGPTFPGAQRLVYGNGKIVALPGGENRAPSEGVNSIGVNVYEKGLWTNLNEKDPVFLKMKGFSSASYDIENRTWYYGSFHDGVMKAADDKSHTIFNQGNSPLQPSENEPSNLLVSDIALDYSNNLWVSTFDVATSSPSLFAKKNDDSWSSFVINHPYASYIKEIVIDYSGYKWLRVEPEVSDPGVLVFDAETGNVKQVNTKQAGMSSGEINDITVDKSGFVWLSTNDGVAVIYNPDEAVLGSAEISRPIYENQYLFRDNIVSCMAVDGGDRKWIGTGSGGVWLFNDDATELIHHFTTKNSPLPSDSITDIVIHEETGEVFIATEKGIVSYRADATEERASFTNVHVFPNPITPGFTGQVGIMGLLDNSSVKITDVSGRVIYETTSNGGAASWRYPNNLNTGVYFVFAIAESGEESLVSKIAIIE